MLRIRTMQGLYMNDVIDDHTRITVHTHVDGLGLVTVARGKWYNDNMIEYFERDIEEYSMDNAKNRIEIIVASSDIEREETAHLFSEMNIDKENPVETLSAFLGRKLLPLR